MYNNDDVLINGDGETSRDFCFVENAVQANILAATSIDKAKNEIYNVALGDRTTLNSLFDCLKESLNNNNIVYSKSPTYQDFRAGDVRHSQACITKAEELLGYEPEYRIKAGIEKAMTWYVKNL